MQESLQQLIGTCTASERGNPLMHDGLKNFCNEHQVEVADFSYQFAKHVAMNFATGAFSFHQADAAMNRLCGAEGVWGVSAFAETVYEAFDSGEFLHDGDPPGTISWQKYTLPAVMEALISEGLLPRAQQFVQSEPAPRAS